VPARALLFRSHVNRTARKLLVWGSPLFTIVAACGGGSGDSSGFNGQGDDSGSSSYDGGGSDSSFVKPGDHPDGSKPTGDSGGGNPDAAMYPQLACNADPPQGAMQAAPLPTYGGTCPKLVAAPTENTITSSGAARQFLLAVPANLQPNEKLPVVFMWHWLGGSGSSFYTDGELQQAVDQQRFLAVMPEKKGDVPYTWPFTIQDSDARMAEEYQFFDDMLACVAQQYPTVNKNCVSSAGVSAGALFTDQLAAARSDRLSSFLSLSGGVGGVVRGWGNPAHKLPGIVLWGGPTDQCQGLLSFASLSMSLEGSLASQGNFMIECIHNCGHSAPPIAAQMGQSKFASLWGFIFDHPFWLGAGESPYTKTGLPSDFPSWCAIGAGHATPRTGACSSPSGC
jgi:predicted esterase